MNEKENIPPLQTPDLKDINRVMDAHAKELMSIPGVVGCYVTLRESGEPCIRVMVVKKTLDLEKKIPSTLEGHPVEIDESGEIKPLSR